MWRCRGPPLVKAGQSGHSRSTSNVLVSGIPAHPPEKLLTAVVVGSSSPSVPNHQQVLDHAVFPIMKKLEGAQTRSVGNQS